jgi:hypothetical protein
MEVQTEEDLFARGETIDEHRPFNRFNAISLIYCLTILFSMTVASFLWIRALYRSPGAKKETDGKQN